MARTTGGFGRLVAPKDGNDQRFLMRSAIPQIKAVAQPTPRKRAYTEGAILDQGSTPHCVGFSAKGFLNAAPLMSKVDSEPTGHALYKSAQALDEWPGENYDGSSVRGGMKALQASGHVSSYVWGQTVDEAIAWMNGGYGTVIIGTEWFELFDHVGPDGFMRVPGQLSTAVGGHAFRLNWYDTKKKGFLVINSWGSTGWGVRGKAYMSVECLSFLLAREGEIAAPVQQRIRPVTL